MAVSRSSVIRILRTPTGQSPFSRWRSRWPIFPPTVANVQGLGLDEALVQGPSSREWLDGLPIGTGRLAAMVLGAFRLERIALNARMPEEGGEPSVRDNEVRRDALPEVRRLLQEIKYADGTRNARDKRSTALAAAAAARNGSSRTSRPGTCTWSSSPVAPSAITTASLIWIRPARRYRTLPRQAIHPAVRRTLGRGPDSGADNA